MIDSLTKNTSVMAWSFDFIFGTTVYYHDWNLLNKFWDSLVSLQIKLVFIFAKFSSRNGLYYAVLRVNLIGYKFADSWKRTFHSYQFLFVFFFVCFFACTRNPYASVLGRLLWIRINDFDKNVVFLKDSGIDI